MAFLEPKIELELDEGEQILHIARRHWIVLLQRSLLSALFGTGAGALAIYRANGGTFIVADIARTSNIDIFSYLLLGLAAVLGVLWWLPRTRNPKNPPRGIPYLLGIALLVLAVIFRYQGGRLFYINPFERNGSDTFNILLIGLVLVLLSTLIYTFIDWANDFLILTNTRVIYDDQELLVRHVQQQMLISDIQQVSLRQDTYPEYWLDYGNILIRSFSPRRLTFDNAAKPKAIQDAILGEVNKLRRQSEPEMLRQMIEDQIYSDKQPKPPRLAIQVEEREGPFPWLFSPNPEINFEKETVTWRPFWPFLVLALLRPVGSFVLLLVIFIFLTKLMIISLGLAFAIGVPALLICAGWTYWVYEEHENDLYILTRQNIIDVDKSPFGPESRRVAPLGAIQDISFNVGFVEAFLEQFFNMGFGDVTIETGGAGGGKFTFRHVPDPGGVQATISDYLTDFRKREKERQLQDAMALIKQYHAAQQSHQELTDQSKLATLIAEQLAAQPVPQAQEVALAEHAYEATARIARHEARTVARAELWRVLRFFRQRQRE